MSSHTSIVQRPIPLSRRFDLAHEEITFRGERYRAVKDPVALRYYYLQPEQFLVFDLLDGVRTLDQLRAALQQNFPTQHVTNADIQSLILDLHRKQLLISHRLGQGDNLMRLRRKNDWMRLKKAVLNPLFVQLPGWNPAKVLCSLDQYLGWLFSKQFAWFAGICILISWLQVAIRVEDLQRKVPEFQQFFGWPNVVYLWISIGVTKIVHEFGHGLACLRFGCRCHSIGLAFLVFSPTMYCDASDSWMLRSKWNRIAIASAGMYVEVLLSTLAIFFWSILQPGLWQNLCFNVFCVSAVSTVVFNANPLIKLDGYFILSDFLEIPNIREKAQATMRHFWAHCSGLQLPTDPTLPKTGKTIFSLYAVSSMIYGWFLLVTISIALYEMLQPYRLQSIGACIAWLTVFLTLNSIALSCWQTIQSAREQKVNRIRLWGTLAIVLAVIAGALFIPIPLNVSAPFVVEPRGLRVISNAEPGVLTDLFVSEGDGVYAGQVIGMLANPEIEDRLADLDVRLRTATSQLKVYDLLEKSEDYAVTEQVIRSIEEERNEWRKRQSLLTLRAPCSGIVCAVAKRQEEPREIAIDQLPRWTGTPLDLLARGAHFDTGTQICCIAPEASFDAIIFLDQHDREDICPGQSVRLLAESLPLHVLDGTVAEVSQRHLEFVPKSLSNKFGGELATVTDLRGRERVGSLVYQVRVEVADSPQAFRLAMRGQAKVLVTSRSALHWLWRFIRETFWFRL